MTHGPVASLGDLLIAVLERGIVLAIRLDGPPGDRRLFCGIGLSDAIDPLLMAVCATSLHRSPVYDTGAHDADDRDWDL